MRTVAKWYIFAALIAVVVVGGLLAYFALTRGQSTFSCNSPLGGATTLKSQLTPVSFNAVTKFRLPPSRNPNAITVAPDGSVWFGEQTLPGFGHLFQNGTLVEYAWPFNYPTDSSSGQICVPKTSIWGVALWNGKVWASDANNNQLVGMDPRSGAFTSVQLTKNFSYPYTLTVGPDNALWFTELYSSQIGRVDLQGKLSEYALLPGGESVPSEIVFANSTRGYFVDAGQAGANNGGVYAFNPAQFFIQKATPELNLSIPTSLALGNGGVWLALHGASSLEFYNFTTKAASSYPTSTVSYISTTLPYFVKSNGTYVWFNEHYGNRMARIDVQNHALTEYSFSSPPANNGSGIDDAITFALGRSQVWFTEWTANYVGFVSASYTPGFSISGPASSELTLKPGSTQQVSVAVSGQSSNPLTVKFSDSESFSGLPKLLSLNTTQNTITSLNGEVTIPVSIGAKSSAVAMQYTVAITVTDGLVSRSTYLTITVTSA